MVRFTASLATAILAFTPSILAGPASKKVNEKPKYQNFLDQFEEEHGSKLFQSEPEVQFFPVEEFGDYANITEIEGAPPNPEKFAREDKREIHGVDDRKYWRGGENTFIPDFPGTSVGMLQIDGGSVCSAALVGPRHVLTARHCIWGKSGFRFSPAFDRGARLGTSNVHAVFASDPAGDQKENLCDVVTDWAILVIDDRFGDQLGYFGAQNPDKAKFDKPLYTSQGYAGDIENAQIPVRQTGNKINTKRSLECKGLGYLSTDTDAMGGQSGSPIWDEEVKGKPQIVGVLSGGASTSDGKGGVEAWTLVASGSDMTGWIKYMRDAFP